MIILLRIRILSCSFYSYGVLLVLLLLHSNCILAQGESFRSLTFAQVDGSMGLSHNNVKSILQDSRGFMWFGTRNKLNRYDGPSVKIFNCYDTNKKRGNNNISALAESMDKLIWVGTDKGVYLFDYSTERFSFFDKKTKTNIGVEDWISDIKEDNQGNIWIVAPNQGVFKYNQKQDVLTFYQVVKDFRHNKSHPQCMVFTAGGELWIGTNNEGVYKYDYKKDAFAQYLGGARNTGLQGDQIFAIADLGEELLVGVHDGKLKKLHKESNTITTWVAPKIENQIIRDVKVFGDKIWIATQSGVFQYDTGSGVMVNYLNDPSLPYSILDNTVEKIYKDKEGNIWFGTHFGGANYIANRGYDFEKFMPSLSKQSISSKIVREIHEDETGKLWIGTEDNGLNIFDPKTKTFLHPTASSHHKNTLGIYLGATERWVGAFRNGVDIYNAKDLGVKHYSYDALGIREGSVYAITEDSEGSTWIGNAWGVFRAPKGSKQFEQLRQFKDIFAFDIKEDLAGNVWVASMGNGLYKYHLKSGKLSHFSIDTKGSGALSSNSVSSITVTRKGEVWVSTDRGGICRYNAAKNDFSCYSTDFGLPDDIAYKIIEDKQDFLWFGTNKGLVKFNPVSLDFRVFTKFDGLPEDQFNYKSALATRDGILYFGTLNGLVSFDSKEIKKNSFIPPVFITKMTLFNKEVAVGDTSILKKTILDTKEIFLDYEHAAIGFEFAALSFVAPKANFYRYKMEGIDEEWINAEHNASVTYAKLPPGKYIFRVQGSNNDGVWNPEDTQIVVHISPPWWYSTGAIVFYILLVCGLVYLYFYWSTKRNQRMLEEANRFFEVEKEKELYKLKTNFVTDMAHEVRTPLTLINGPLEAILQKDIKDNEVRKDLLLIEKSSAQLLTLINQMLDFKKVDNNNFALYNKQEDILGLLRDLIEPFAEYARHHGPIMTLHIPTEPLYTSIDKDAFAKIINNLLSNALKYSSKEIVVDVQYSSWDLQISIRNDGKKISPQHETKIFEIFYRIDAQSNSNTSSGIGLSLSKSFAELMGGTLVFDPSREDNTFVLSLPLLNKEPIEAVTAATSTDELLLLPSFDSNDGLPVVLFLDDNTEILSFLNDKLGKTIKVRTAATPKRALELLKTERIDLIVSDVIMDEMDGVTFCTQVKNDSEWSHIPIILLTAKNDLESRINGLEAGAEAYIEKPFSLRYLASQIETLLNNRQRERDNFVQRPFQQFEQQGLNKNDHQFINKVIQVIQENIADQSFSVERLADLVFVSRASLLRKIKAISGLSPTDFIKAIRLKKAAEYLVSGEYQINEVTYLVGISSASYFIKIFQKQFGMTPAEFIKKQQQS